MARIDTLANFLTDVAEAIKDKTGQTSGIKPADFDTAIASISNSGADEPVVEPDYITDGLVAWWEGCDELDENKHWNSRVGTDYIYAALNLVGSNENNAFDTIKTSNSYKNNMIYGLRTLADYYLAGYTFEVVGKSNSNQNSTQQTSSATCSLLTFHKSGSPMIAVGFNNGLFLCLNVSASSSGPGLPTKIVNCVGKKHKYVIHLGEISTRGSSGYNQIDYSVNNSGWFAMDRTYLQSGSTTEDHTNIMCYYTDSYIPNCEIYSIRIYNRKLTEEELLHNYEIDNARFKLDDYETA